MDINAIGLPTNRAVLEQSSATPQAASKLADAPNYDGTTSDLDKVNTAKAALPDGVGTRVDKSA